MHYSATFIFVVLSMVKSDSNQFKSFILHQDLVKDIKHLFVVNIQCFFYSSLLKGEYSRPNAGDHSTFEHCTIACLGPLLSSGLVLFLET